MIILQGYNHFFLIDDGKPPVKVDGYPDRVIHVGTLLGKGFEPKFPRPNFNFNWSKPRKVNSFSILCLQRLQQQ